MYEYIIFDVDGTLIDTHQATILALQEVLIEETGKIYNTKELEFVIGIPGEVSLPRLGVKDINHANRKWNAYLKRYSDYIEVFPGIRELFPALESEGIRTGLVTSNTRYELDGLMYYFLPLHLKQYVRHMVCADDTKRHKPYPDPILKFLEMSEASCSKVLYIGDTEYDMRCARAAMIDFGLAKWGVRSTKSIDCKYTFNHSLDILKMFQKNIRKEKVELYES
jgi:HAD superfamily hydrolase (TIGR01549 family)